MAGGNQREVQKRYRERKKNHTKMLEEKVKELERKLAAFENEKRELDKDSAIGSMAIGRVVDPMGCGTDEENASGPRDSALPQICPGARQFMEKLDPLVGRLRDLLDRGPPTPTFAERSPTSSPSAPRRKRPARSTRCKSS